MKLAADFRSIARGVLREKWSIAVLVGLVATILGAAESAGPEITFKMDEFGSSVGLEYAGQTIASTGGAASSGIGAIIAGGATVLAIAAAIVGIIYFVLGSIVAVGYAYFNLNLVDHKEAVIGNLFEYFSKWDTVVIANFLRRIYVALWTLLLIVPGIMASYSYAMTNYILAEHPELSANEAIGCSKEMMAGNRWRLFCLQFSFIGWDLLAILTLGIGHLFVRPYKEAAIAAFYREVSGTEYIVIE